MNRINYQNYIIDINQYEKIEHKNQTSFSVVNLVRNKTTGEKFIAKTLIKQKNENLFKKMVNREITIMILLDNNPNIAKIIGYSMQDLEGNDNITIIMKYYQNGSLADFLENARKGVLKIVYNNTMKQKFLIGIIRSLLYLHNLKICHRDLKPDNCLLDDDYNPVLTDFGLSSFFENNSVSTQSMQCGTLIYNAPEILETNSKNYENKRDIYAFGIMMNEIISGKKPYPELDSNNISQFQFTKKVIDENYRPKIFQPIKSDLKQLIKQCWAKNPSERPTAEKIYQKLAFGVDNFLLSSLNMFNDPNTTDKNKYCLDDVDEEEIKAYIEKIDINFGNDKFQQEINNLKQECTNYEQMNKELKQRCEEMEKIHEQEKIELMDNNIKLQQELKQMNDIEEEKIKLKQELKKMNDTEEENTKLKQELKKMNDTEEENTKLKQELKKMNDTEEENTKLKQELKKMNDTEEENTKLKQELKKMNDTEDENTKLKQELKKMNDIKEENTKLKQELKKMNDTEEENTKLKQELKKMNDIKEENTKLKQENTKLKEENKSYEAIIQNDNNSNDMRYRKTPNHNNRNKTPTRRSQSVTRATDNFFNRDKKSISTNYDYFLTKQKTSKELYTFLQKQSDKDVKSRFVQNIEALNSFLLKQNDNDIKSYFSIISKENLYEALPRDTEFPISICYKTIEMMLASSETTKFSNILSKFNRIIIETKYESIKYESARDFALNLSKSINNIKIALKISGNGKTDMKFQNNKNISFIKICSDVNEIKGNKNGGSFSNCTRLEEVFISSSVQIIGASAFNNCTSLKKVLFDKNSRLSKIGSSSFNNCSSLTHITIPSSVTEIPKNCFFNCSSLTKIEIPDSVIKIDSFAFCNCTKLETINIPNHVSSIEDNSFKECKSLKQILIPSSVDFIGISSFMNCISLTYVYIDENSCLKSLEDNAFYGCRSLETISIPSSLIKIGNKCFYECEQLKEISLGSQIINIGESSFYKCTNLENVSFEDSVEFIGQSCFAYCKSLKQFSIPPKIKTVEINTFLNCSSLIKIEIPTSVTTICESSFEGCSKLIDIKFHFTLKQIKNKAFIGCSSLKQTNMPRTVKFTQNTRNSTFPDSTSITFVDDN